jgi:hypothetical protein
MNKGAQMVVPKCRQGITTISRVIPEEFRYQPPIQTLPGQFAQMQPIQSVNLINYFHLRLRYKRVELYLHFIIRIRGIK